MTSFSIDSILALQETKCGTAQANGIHKNKIEELRDEDISSTKYRDHRSSPNASPAALGIEESSYEGTDLCNFLFHMRCVCQVCHLLANLFKFISVEVLRLGTKIILPSRFLNCAFSSDRLACKKNFLFFGITRT